MVASCYKKYVLIDQLSKIWNGTDYTDSKDEHANRRFVNLIGAIMFIRTLVEFTNDTNEQFCI